MWSTHDNLRGYGACPSRKVLKLKLSEIEFKSIPQYNITRDCCIRITVLLECLDFDIYNEVYI